MGSLRSGLLGEIVTMSIDTLRTNKMRSALTVLGVVIGITSIVGMTSLIRGFDESLRESISAARARTRSIVQKMGALSLALGQDASWKSLRRPNLTIDDATRDRARLPVGGDRGRLARRHGRQQPVAHLLQEPADASRSRSSARPRTLPPSAFTPLMMGRFFVPSEVEHRRQVVVLGPDPVPVALPERRSDRQAGADRQPTSSRSSAWSGSARRPGGFNTGADDFAVIPVHDAREVLRQGADGERQHVDSFNSAIPHGDDRGRAARGRRARAGDARSREVMRIRHNLKLDSRTTSTS